MGDPQAVRDAAQDRGGCFEFFRKLDGAKPWPETAAELKAQVDKLTCRK